jgi:hypothetical protein
MTATYGPIYAIHLSIHNIDEGEYGPQSVIEVYHEYAPAGLPIVYYAEGDLATLIRLHRRRKCPVGIVLDRLQEYPNELEADQEEVDEILTHLRSQPAA